MASSSVISGAGLCLAVIVAAPRAQAFCRTTTTAAPVPYDPVADGCWTQGTPLSWHIARVPIGVISAASSQLALADATRVEDLVLAADAPATRAIPPRATTSCSTTPAGRTTTWRRPSR